MLFGKNPFRYRPVLRSIPAGTHHTSASRIIRETTGFHGVERVDPGHPLRKTAVGVISGGRFVSSITRTDNRRVLPGAALVLQGCHARITAEDQRCGRPPAVPGNSAPGIARWAEPFSGGA